MKENKNHSGIVRYIFVGLTAIGLAVFIAFIINCVYTKGTVDGSVNTVFTESDVLLYCGAVLTFIGTTVLGLAAWRQNENANKISERLLNISEYQLNPYLKIEEEFEFFADEGSGIVYYIIGIKNSSDKPIRLKGIPQIIIDGRSYLCRDDSIYYRTILPQQSITLYFEILDNQRLAQSYRSGNDEVNDGYRYGRYNFELWFNCQYVNNENLYTQKNSCAFSFAQSDSPKYSASIKRILYLSLLSTDLLLTPND